MLFNPTSHFSKQKEFPVFSFNGVCSNNLQAEDLSALKQAGLTFIDEEQEGGYPGDWRIEITQSGTFTWIKDRPRLVDIGLVGANGKSLRVTKTGYGGNIPMYYPSGSTQRKVGIGFGGYGKVEKIDRYQTNKDHLTFLFHPAIEYSQLREDGLSTPFGYEIEETPLFRLNNGSYSWLWTKILYSIGSNLYMNPVFDKDIISKYEYLAEGGDSATAEYNGTLRIYPGETTKKAVASGTFTSQYLEDPLHWALYDDISVPPIVFGKPVTKGCIIIRNSSNDLRPWEQKQ